MMTSKPWHTKEWKEKRDAFIHGKACVQCGSQENLVVHHTKKLPPDNVIFNEIRDILIKKVVDDGLYVTDYREICPICTSVNIRSRMTMVPVYICNRCQSTFDNPKITRSYRLSKEDFRDFINKYGDEIREAVLKFKNNYFETHYKEFKDCVVLCKKCHMLHHKGLDLCPICKQNFKQSGFDTCYDCFLKSDNCVRYLHPWCNNEIVLRKGSYKHRLCKNNSPDAYCVVCCKERSNCALLKKNCPWFD